MAVELLVSLELADTIGEEDLVGYLDMFGATIIDSHRAEDYLQIVYTLDVPDAPAGAQRVEPVWQQRADRTVRLLTINWYDADGRPTKGG